MKKQDRRHTWQGSSYLNDNIISDKLINSTFAEPKLTVLLNWVDIMAMERPPVHRENHFSLKIINIKMQFRSFDIM